MHPTLFIGLDGATFTILDPLMEAGVMPFLRETVAKGVRARLLSTANPLTPPAWTTMMTGRHPGSHGIIDFIWAEQRATEHYFTLYNFRDIRTETIWSMVSRQGGRIAALNFPIMAPPPAVNGFVVPGLVSWKHLRRNIHPPGLYEELQAMPGFEPREFAWDFGLEKKAARGVPAEEMESWVEFHRRRERHWHAIARQLIGRGGLDLAAVLFDGMDKMLHIGWRLLDPACQQEGPSAADQRLRVMILAYFRELDSFVAELYALAGEEARLVVASDHGFGPAFEVFRVNSWLAEQGYLVWKETEEADEATRRGVERLVNEHFVLLDWEKTLAYARTTTANGIYIARAKALGQPGVPERDYEAFRHRLKEQLLALASPETGLPVVQAVLTREEAYPGAHNQQAPDLTLVLRDHSFVSILRRQPVVCRRPQVEGTHHPEGVFIARGPGFFAGRQADTFSIANITPVLLHALGLAIPEDLEGEVPAGVFAEDFLQASPVRRGPPTMAPDSYAVQPPARSAAEEKAFVLRQMQALGYIE
ncbi:MAG: alkaline phosphatase family protein [Thermodesulfobacteriota bacterium]